VGSKRFVSWEFFLTGTVTGNIAASGSTGAQGARGLGERLLPEWAEIFSGQGAHLGGGLRPIRPSPKIKLENPKTGAATAPLVKVILLAGPR